MKKLLNLQLENFESKLMLYFGVIILVLIMLLSGLFVSLYHWALIKEHDKLCLTISNLVKRSVVKIDNIGDESNQIMIQEIQMGNPEIEYIWVIDQTGNIVAHSEPGAAGKKISAKELGELNHVLKANSHNTYDAYVEGRLIREVIIPIKISGKDFGLKVGIVNEEFVENLRNSFWFVLFFAIGTTALAMIYVHFLSAKLAGPVKEMAQKFQGILNYAPMMIIIKDRQGSYDDISKSCYKMLPKGTKVEDTMSLFSLIPQDQMVKIKKDEEAIFKGEKELANEEYNLQDSTGERNIIMTTFPVTQDADKKVTHLCHVSVDITERIHLREQFMQAQKMESLGHLAGGISHDFNNLISVIMGYTSLLLTYDSIDDEAKGDINNIKLASQRATSLVQKLMAFSRRDPMLTKKTDINLLLKETEKMLSRLIPENINLKMELVSYPLFVLVDAGHLEQALINLINNSMDAIGKEEEGDIKVSTSMIEFSSKNIPTTEMQAGKYVEISVSDTGSGIDKSIQSKIFEPFFTTKTGNKGTGLGLSMVYGVVRQLRGDIIVDSEFGEGTTFKLYLPLEPGSDINTEEKQKVSQEKHQKETHGNKTILVAEDELFVRMLVVKTLKKFNYKVIPAENGQQAVDMALTNNVDLLLTDIIMPFKNGTDAYLEIRESKPDLPCIYMSGYTAELLDNIDQPAEKINFIQKPISLDELLTKIQEVLKEDPSGKKTLKKK